MLRSNLFVKPGALSTKLTSTQPSADGDYPHNAV
jgi:hypothetical protein